MQTLSQQQSKQELQYAFPYHYIPSWDGRTFSQAKTLAWGYEYLSYLNFVLEIVEKTTYQRLLDVGCGDGRFLHELSQKPSTAGKKLAGIDYSPRAVSYGKISTPSVEWHSGDIREKGAFSPAFDIITLIETLEHIPPKEINSFLEGVHQYLSENGKVYITVPSKNIPVNTKHYQHFDLPSLEQTLNQFFNIVEVYYLNRRPDRILKWLQRLLVNRLFILNHPGTLRRIYRYYLKRYLHANPKNCSRLVVVCEMRKPPQ